MSVDWARIAEPQPDGYDTSVVLAYAKMEKQQVTEDTPLFLGAVPLRQVDRMLSPELSDAPLDHPHIALTEEHLRRWPVVATQVASLLTTIFPLLDSRYPVSPDSQGCTCGGTDKFGEIYTSINDPLGAGEGVVHEMGHWKLHALGVHLTDWDDLLLDNSPEELYVSPIRKDIKRPIGAVLHAQLSYVYVTELDVRVMEATEGQQGRRHLSINLPRIVEGFNTLRENVRGTEAGEAFIAGFFRWNERVIAEGTAMLENSI